MYIYIYYTSHLIVVCVVLSTAKGPWVLILGLSCTHPTRLSILYHVHILNTCTCILYIYIYMYYMYLYVRLCLHMEWNYKGWERRQPLKKSTSIYQSPGIYPLQRSLKLHLLAVTARPRQSTRVQRAPGRRSSLDPRGFFHVLVTFLLKCRPSIPSYTRQHCRAWFQSGSADIPPFHDLQSSFQ